MKRANETPRKRILEEALRLFQSQDYSQVKIRDICAAAHCSESTFYYQFKNKARLLMELYSEREILRKDRLVELLSLTGPWERLWHIHSIYISEFEEMGPKLCSDMLAVLASPNEYVDVQFNGLAEEVMIPLILQAQQAGEILNTAPPERLLDAVAAAAYGLEIIWTSTGGKCDLFAQGRRIFEALYNVREDLRAG